MKIFKINLDNVFLALRCAGYALAWLVLGSFTIESALMFATGGAVVEFLWQGYKKFTRNFLVRKIDKQLNFYKLIDGKVTPCTREETEEQLDKVVQQIRNTSASHIAPFYKHAHVGPVCLTAAWTGVSLKDGPVEPWDLQIRLEAVGAERTKSFSSWEEVEREFDKIEIAFRKAAGILTEATKPPTLH